MSLFKIRFHTLLIVAALVVAYTLGAPAQAHASFKLTISDSDGNTVIVNDNNLPPGTDADTFAQLGRIGFSGSIGVFDIAITTGTSNAPGSLTKSQLTINNTSITSTGFTGTKTLTFKLEDTGFTSPTGDLTLVSQLSNIQLPVGGADVTYQSFLDANAGTALNLNTLGGVQNYTQVSVTSTPYTLTSITTVTVTGMIADQTVQFTGLTAAVVPAPSSLVLCLASFPVLGLGWWLRRRGDQTLAAVTA